MVTHSLSPENATRAKNPPRIALTPPPPLALLAGSVRSLTRSRLDDAVRGSSFREHAAATLTPHPMTTATAPPPEPDLRYPVGRWTEPDADAATYTRLIDQIEEAPRRLRAAIDGLSAAQLDTPYRDGGWTVRQVVHHVPDSHLNAYVRFKLALTEDTPRIKPYEESRWALLADARLDPPVSLALLDALHERWLVILRAMTPDDFERRSYDHPEMGVVSLRTALGIYAWHGRHHVANITRLRERMGW